MLQDGDGYGEATTRYVRDYFANLLAVSLAWSRLGATVVRYEDLIANPIDRLQRLADGIQPVTAHRLRKAVLLSEFRRMKAAVDPKAGLQPWKESHFRKGEAGSWRAEIGESPVLEVLRSTEPFKSQFEALGYSLDDGPAPAAFSYATIDPFGEQERFDNGVRLSTVMVRFYLDHPGSERTWPDPLDTSSPSSFYAWLNAPADGMDGARAGEVLLTNFMECLYRFRLDLQRALPDPVGADRLEFAWWFLTYGAEEHRIAPEFTAPIQESFTRLATRLGAWSPDLALSAKGFPPGRTPDDEGRSG
jgi:hypothetical protein